MTTEERLKIAIEALKEIQYQGINGLDFSCAVVASEVLAKIEKG